MISSLQYRVAKLEQSYAPPDVPMVMFVQFVGTDGPCEVRSALCGGEQFVRLADEDLEAFKDRVQAHVAEQQRANSVHVVIFADEIDASL